MLRGAFDSAGEFSPAELRTEYERRLIETVDDVGVETVAAETEIDQETVQALVDGDSPELTLDEAADILATEPDGLDKETIMAEARDILLMGMSMAVLDVEALASGIDDEMEPKEIQQKVEGRYPITLAEYATLHQYIESEKR
ncbi:MAG: DUF5791 family protein [Halovenus sp.]|uniref:DUF5791 family protein n=1 Tax=Halovenus amylolytica TaxID=2500550 RepID=UPI000FE441AE